MKTNEEPTTEEETKEQKKKKKLTAADLGLITNEDLCEALNISRWTAATLRKSGKLPYQKYGSRYFYRMADLNAMIENDFKKDSQPVIAREE